MTQSLRVKVGKIRSLVDDQDLVSQNRRLLIETATKLFRAKGYHNTSTRDIALKAGISVGSIYQYILKKEDLVVLILSSVVEIYDKTIYPLAQGEGRAKDRLWDAVAVYYRTLDDHHAKTDVLYHNFSEFDATTKRFLGEIEERVSGIIKTILDQGVADGDFKPVNTTFAAHNIVSMGHMWALKRGRFRDVMTIDQYIAEQHRHLEETLLEVAAPSSTAITKAPQPELAAKRPSRRMQNGGSRTVAGPSTRDP